MCGCLEIALIAFGMYCTGRMWHVYRERRNLTSVYLFFMFLFFGLFPIGFLIDVFFWTLGEVTALYILPYGYTVGISIFSGFVVFSLFFTTEVFARGGTKLSRSTVAIRVVFITFHLSFSILSSVFMFSNAMDYFTLVFTIFVFSNLILFLLIFVSAHSLARWVAEVEYKRPLRYIGNFGLLIGIAHVFSILDTTVSGRYSEYAVISWVFYLMAVYVMYLGFIRPHKRVKELPPSLKTT